MGMYTELVFDTELSLEKLPEIEEVLRHMLGESQEASYSSLSLHFQLPAAALFKSSRWEYMLRGSSFYFNGETHSELNVMTEYNIATLTVRCSLKNYSQEIEKFLDWIYSYDETDWHTDYAPRKMFKGYMRYEEDVHPTLIYFTKNGVEFVKTGEETERY